MPTTYVKSGGSWIAAREVHYKYNGTWRELLMAYQRDGDSWRRIFSKPETLSMTVASVSIYRGYGRGAGGALSPSTLSRTSPPVTSIINIWDDTSNNWLNVGMESTAGPMTQSTFYSIEFFNSTSLKTADAAYFNNALASSDPLMWQAEWRWPAASVLGLAAHVGETLSIDIHP